MCQGVGYAGNRGLILYSLQGAWLSAKMVFMFSLKNSLKFLKLLNRFLTIASSFGYLISSSQKVSQREEDENNGMWSTNYPDSLHPNSRDGFYTSHSATLSSYPYLQRTHPLQTHICESELSSRSLTFCPQGPKLLTWRGPMQWLLERDGSHHRNQTHDTIRGSCSIGKRSRTWSQYKLEKSRSWLQYDPTSSVPIRDQGLLKFHRLKPVP